MRRLRGLFFLILLAVLSVVIVVSCGGEGDPPAGACVEGLSLTCQPLYDPPTYQTLFEKTFRPTCASGVGTCHTGDAAKGGLVFEDADTAYAMLLGENGTGADAGHGGKKRVLAHDPACSLLVTRLESKVPSFRMPPGTNALPDAERCAIVKWIANGAQR